MKCSIFFLALLLLHLSILAQCHYFSSNKFKDSSHTNENTQYSSRDAKTKELLAEMSVPKINSTNNRSALIVIDVQNCFLPSGAIPVVNGDQVIPIINSLRNTFSFDAVVFSQDWHCPAHISFNTVHGGSFAPVELTYRRMNGKTDLCKTPGSGSFSPTVDCFFTPPDPSYISFNQTIWPVHCVEGTVGAKLSSKLDIDPGSDYIIKKGTSCNIDSYSAFEDNGGLQKTELESNLKSFAIQNVFVVGLTLDYCVKYTALDALTRGFNTYVVLDATKATSPDGENMAIQELMRAGVTILYSKDIPATGLKRQAPWYTSFIVSLLLLLASIGFGVGFVISMVAPNPQPMDRVPLLSE